MANEQDFAAQLKELEAITAWFESDEADLNEALAKFERGMELASHLKTHLKTVENRVDKIKQKFSATNDMPITISEPELD